VLKKVVHDILLLFLHISLGILWAFFRLAEVITIATEEHHRALQGFEFTNADDVKVNCH